MPAVTTTLIRSRVVVAEARIDPRQTDVAITRDLIGAAGGSLRREADVIVNADGQLGCVGFMVPHGHSDMAVLISPHGTSKLLQGVTAEVISNCGARAGPRDGPHANRNAPPGSGSYRC
jgi:N-acyl-D-amino-acid deacylase